MKQVIASLLFLLFCQGIFASGDPLIINVDHRNTQSLNGKWHTIVDPYQSGYYSYRYQPREDGFFRNRKPQDKSDRIEYNFDTDDLLHVPGDWNTQDDQLFFYEGTVWYKKSFHYTKSSGKRVFLYFGAANYEAIVYLNGEKLGSHVGGFTPFNFEVTDKIQDGENFVVVKVDNRRKQEGVPTLMTDWWNYGGLTRRVMLIETPMTFIRDYFIQLAPGSENQIAGWVQLDGEQTEQNLSVSIPEAGIETTATADDQGYTELEFSADLELWSPENPKLYDVRVVTESDTITDRIGFRTITTRGSEILLNGEPIFLRGICMHEEAPFRAGRAYSREDAEVLLNWAKEMNCNYVRLAHYPHNEHMIRMADEMGLLVWSEIPVYWTILWDNEGTFRNAKQQLSENITRDKNRASVILWSMANETPLSEPRHEFLRKLVEHSKQLDPTRLVTAALELHYVAEDTVMIDDPLGAHLDVLGCNEYIGWYDGLPSKAERIHWKTIYDKPLVISEFGGGALYNYHGDSLTRWTEEFQASIYRHQIPMLNRIDFLAGTTPWILMDFLSPRRPLPEIQDYWNRKGLISDQGQKKQAFYVMQNFYKRLMEKR